MPGVGIMTFLHNQNYGSSLQAYALQRVIREMGFSCEHIDYRPDRGEKIRNLLRSGNSPKLILEGLRKKSVQRDQAGARQKRAEIDAFYDREMRLSPPCRNGQALKEQGKRYDILLCGSDQIWNPVWLNPAYFLNFAAPGQKKVAYAASLGVQQLESKKKQEMFRRLTGGFDAVSIREAEGAALYQRITGHAADVMPDPVCLLSGDQWRELAKAWTGEKDEGSPCLLCYFIGENPSYWETVRQLAKDRNLPVRVVPVTAESYASGYPLLEGLGPAGFLRAVDRAAVLCTDSFHGLVLATLLNTETNVLRRDREDDPENKNSRVEHFRRLMAQDTPENLRQQGLEWLTRQLGTAGRS